VGFPFFPGQTSSVSELGLAEPVVDRSVGPIPVPPLGPARTFVFEFHPPFLRRGEDLLRVKDILNLIGETAPVVIHGVHHIFHPPVQLDGWPDADHRSRIVFITRGIDRADLDASFLDHVVASRKFDASVRA
jgi:hypothetical protein